MLKAFKGSTKQMVRVTHLAHPGKKARLALSIDASGRHVGVALQQETLPGSVQPLGFFSSKLNIAEQQGWEFVHSLIAHLLSVLRPNEQL